MASKPDIDRPRDRPIEMNMLTQGVQTVSQGEKSDCTHQIDDHKTQEQTHKDACLTKKKNAATQPRPMPEDYIHIEYPKKRKLGEETRSPSIQLVKHNQESKSIVVNRNAIKLLSSIEKPVAVLGICGPYRTGKSYFVSQVLGGDDFKVSHSRDPCTKGIWMSTSVLEFNDHTLIVLDTEGIGAAQASETSREDLMSILILVTLLSSCLVYNTKGGAFTESDVQQMSCLAQLSRSVLISESHQHDDLHENDLTKHFPNLLLLNRDSDLGCFDDHGEKMSATDYVLKKILVTHNNGDKPLSTRDITVKNIRAIFSKIECLDIPAPGSGISNPNKKDLIDPDFHTSINAAKRHVVSKTPVKRGFNGSTGLNGPMLAALLDEYVEALNKPGTVPNLEDSYQNAVKITLMRKAFELAEKYHKQMSTLLDSKPPLEEGDIENLNLTHSERLEESLNGDILKTHTTPIEGVKKFDVLFDVHIRVYTDLLRDFTVELQKLIPESADTHQILKKDEQRRKKELLETFEKLIITVTKGSGENLLLGGYISHFTENNTIKSENTCKEVCEMLNKNYVQTGAPEHGILEAEYYDRAFGPAKDKVFENMTSQIPGPPQNVTMNLETHVLSWDKPLLNADAANYYYIELKREGEDPKEYKIPTNNQFKLKKLKPKTNYVIKIQGFNNLKRWRGECSTVSFQTRAEKPEKPKMPKIVPQSEEIAILTMTMLSEAEQNGSPVTNIIVSRRSDKNSIWKFQTFSVDPFQGDLQTQEVYVNCEDNEEVLDFRVEFENEAGVSEPSDSAQLEIADMIPGKPENIKTIAEARQIQVDWDPPITNPGAVNSYLVQYREKGDDQELFQSKSDKTVYNNERSMRLTSLSPYTEYTVRVYAKNKKNMMANGYSTVDVRTLADVPDKPHPPTIRVTSAREAMITFYRQKRNEENGSQVSKIAIEQQSKHKEQATNWNLVKEYPVIESDISKVDLPVELINLTEPSISCYIYRVVTVNSIGRSKPSQAVEVYPDDMIPGSPQGLDSTKTSNSITISWKKPKVNPLISKQYQVNYKEVKGKKWTLEKAIASGTRSYEVSDLRPNTEYTFIVQALNETDVLISEKATLIVRTSPSVPAKPSLPKMTPKGEEFTLKAYLPPVKHSGRKVTQLHVNYYGKTCDSLQKTIDYIVDEHQASVQSNPHEQQVQLNTNDTWWISINLSNEVGKSEESDLVPISPSGVIPGIPDKLECTPDARNVKLSWNMPQKNGNAAKDYEVLLRDTKTHEWETKNATIHQTRLNETLSFEATVNDLSPITTYSLGVRAFNSKTCIGNISELVATTTSAPPDKPLKPIAVRPDPEDPLRANLEFKMLSKEQMNGSSVDCVIIECEFYKKAFELTAEQQVENTSTELEIDLPNLRDSIKTYSFCIQMKNGEGESPPSDAFMLPVSELQPGPPNNVQISDHTAHTLKVQWKEPNIHPALVKQYNIEYTAVQTSRHDENTITVKSEAREYIISKLRSGQQYCIKVIAVATKHSDPTPNNATTEYIYPSAPTSLIVKKISNISVKVGWEKPKERPEEVCFYKVELREGNCTNVAKANIPEVKQERLSMGYSTVFKNLVPHTTYTVSVSSYNDNNGTQDAMECLMLTTKMSTAAKVALGILSAPTVVGPIAIAITQARDEDINSSDDEFDDKSDTYTSAAENLS